MFGQCAQSVEEYIDGFCFISSFPPKWRFKAFRNRKSVKPCNGEERRVGMGGEGN